MLVKSFDKTCLHYYHVFKLTGFYRHNISLITRHLVHSYSFTSIKHELIMQKAFFLLVIVTVLVASFWVKKQEANQKVEQNPIIEQSTLGSDAAISTVQTDDATTPSKQKPKVYTTTNHKKEQADVLLASHKQNTIPPPKLDNIDIVKHLATQKEDTHQSKAMSQQRAIHPLAKLLKKTTTTSQFFTIDNTKETIIQAKNGTLLSIPSDCFIQTDTTAIFTGKVHIELKEILSTPELVLSNIPTISPYGMLVGDGVLYLHASEKSTGKPLKMGERKNIYVEMPTENRDARMWVCYGQFNHQGNINWTASTQPTSDLIAIPLPYLDFEDKYLKSTLHAELNNAKYENTFIATREFEHRVAHMQANAAIYQEHLELIVSHYLDNVHSNLFHVDYQLYQYFKSLIAEANSAETNEVTALKRITQTFRQYYHQKLTQPVNLTPYGLNLGEDNAFAALRSYGMSTKKANSLLLINNTRNALIKERMDNKQKQTSKSTNYSFLINQTGWITLDKYEQHNKPKRQLAIQLNNSKAKTIPSAIYLVFKDFKTIVPASYKAKQDQYLFRGLPLGEEGHLVAIGYKNRQPYIHTKEIVVGQNYLETLTMRPTTLDMLKYEVGRLN